jgi:hypothetical protein
LIARWESCQILYQGTNEVLEVQGIVVIGRHVCVWSLLFVAIVVVIVGSLYFQGLTVDGVRLLPYDPTGTVCWHNTLPYNTSYDVLPSPENFRRETMWLSKKIQKSH